MLTYPGVVDLPESTLTFLAGPLAEDRAQRRTWRKLPPREQALLVLVHLRKGERYEQLAEGFRVSVGTVHNYIREAVGLLATHGRTLLAAVWIFGSSKLTGVGCWSPVRCGNRA